jgi:hypothetical protein
MAEYDHFKHGLSKGEFFAEGPHDFERRPVVLLQGDFGEDARTTVQHELTHMLARYYYPQLPVWLNEGLARYLETLTCDGTTAVIGRPSPRSRFWQGPLQVHATPMGPAALLPVADASSVEELRAMPPAVFYATRRGDLTRGEEVKASVEQSEHYQAAWGLVHLLSTDAVYGSAFADYLRRIRAGAPERVAWAESIGRLDAAKLETDYRAALIAKEHTLLRTKYVPIAPAPEQVRRMDDAEVHALWARLRDWSGEREKEAAAEVALARTDATVPSIAEVLAQWDAVHGDRAGAEKTIEGALAQHPADPTLWNTLGWFLANDLRDALRDAHAASPDTTSALRRVADKLAPIATSASEYDLLAHVSAMNRSADDALANEKRAVAADPNCVPCLGFAAQVMLAKGMPREALDVATLALGLSAESGAPPWIAAIARRASTAAVATPAEAKAPDAAAR